MNRKTHLRLLAGIVTLAIVSNSYAVSPRASASRSAVPARVTAPIAKPEPRSTLEKLPMIFEENHGQLDPAVSFATHRKGYDLFLTPAAAVMNLKDRNNGIASLWMRFVNANSKPRVTGELPLPSISNYYRGNDSAKWITRVPHYGQVGYRDLYPGIDLKFYQGEGALEYDFIVAPGADPGRIAVDWDGADEVTLDQEGNLRIRIGAKTVTQAAPVVYQESAQGRTTIEGRFVPLTGHRVGFVVGQYDRKRPLVIDPRISYLTYLGGDTSSVDETDAIAVDAAGNAYVSGATEATDFPTPNSRSDRMERAIYVAKIDPVGHSLLYLTFLDGEDIEGNTNIEGDRGNDIAVDAGGNVYTTGTTFSDRFPVTSGAFQGRRSTCGPTITCAYENSEAFVAKLDSRGSIVYCTYLGGRKRDIGNGIAVDATGRAYVTGLTDSGLTFPVKNEFQSTGVFGQRSDAFLTVFNTTGTDISYSTGFGGTDDDFALSIGLDSSNHAYITGQTRSDNLPTKNALQNANGGGRDAFVARFNTALTGESSLIYSTYLGGAGGDVGQSIAVLPNGRSFITGLTGSFNFPMMNAIDSTNEINEAFVTELSSTGALTNSTFLGGDGQESGTDIAVDGLGNIWVTGSTSSDDFPRAADFQSALQGPTDAFVTKLRFDAGLGLFRGVLSSSYLGGSAGDTGRSLALFNSEVVYVCGSSSSTNLPTTPGVLKAFTNNGDGFVARILDSHEDSVGLFRPGSFFFLAPTITSNVTQGTNFGPTGQLGVSGDWNGDGVRTIGTYSSGVWHYRNVNFVSSPASSFNTVNFGLANDLPVVGDWNGDGIDTPGVFRPSTNQFFLTDSTSNNPAITRIINFGVNGDKPIAGDWDGDGVDSVGVFRPAQATFLLTNQTAGTPTVDAAAFFGIAGDIPLAGDWNGDGVDTVGVWRPSATTFFLSDDNVTTLPTLTFGASTDQPVIGDWDGKP